MRDEAVEKEQAKKKQNRKESGTTSTGETRKRPVMVTVLHRINQSTE